MKDKAGSTTLDVTAPLAREEGALQWQWSLGWQ